MTISIHLSGNGTAAGSLGGARSAVSAVGVELFGHGKDFDRVNGETQYRCIYVSSDEAEDAVAFFVANGAVRIGWGSAINSQALSIPNKNTAPAGVTFAAPADYAAATPGGDFGPDDFRQLWIEYTVAAGAGMDDDSFALGVFAEEGEEPVLISALTDINAAANTLPEDSPIGTPLPVQLQATHGIYSMTYSLTDDAGGKLGINASTGIPYLAAAVAASDSPIAFSARAASGDGVSTAVADFSLTVTASLTAVADTDAAANTIDADAGVGDYTGLTLLATHAGYSVTMSLTDDAGGLFAIDSSTGQVEVADSLAAGTHSITARATSSDGVSTADLTADIEVTGGSEPAMFYVGAVSHVAWHWALATQQSQLAALNTTAFRDEFNWSVYETTLGTYNKAGHSAGIQAMINGSVDVSTSMLTLGYGNSLYSVRPIDAPSRTGFANYCAKAVEDGCWRFPILQIWNEWNLSGGNPGPGTVGNTPANYKLLFDSAATAMRDAGYTGKIITTGLGPAVSGSPGGGVAGWEAAWDAVCQGYVDAGVYDNADGCGLHPYTWGHGSASGSELVIERIERMRAMLTAKYGAESRDIYITEWGWPVISTSGYTDSQVGAWIQEVIAACKALGYVRCLYIYQLRDESSSTTNVEQNFGLHTNTGTLKGRGTAFSEREI